MATEKDVLLKLGVQVGGTKQVDDLKKSVDGLTESQKKQASQPKAQVSASDRAAQVFQRQQFDLQVKQELAKLNPQGAGGGGLPPGLGKFIAAEFIGQGINQLGRGLQQFRQRDVTAIGGDVGGAGDIETAKALGSAFSTMADGLPIIGNFKKGIEGVVDALFIGANAAKSAQARFAGQSGIAIGAAGQESQLRLGSQFQQDALARQRADAQLAAASNRNALSRLTPEQLASFRSQTIAGVRDAGTGAANFGVFSAQGGVEAAEAAVRQREAELQRAKNAELIARGGVGDRNAQAVRAGQAFDKGNVAQQTQFDATSAKEIAANEKLIEQRNLLLKLGNDRDSLEKQTANTMERQKALNEAQNQLEQKRFELAQAQIAVDKNRLGILQQQLDNVKGGVTALGFADPSQAKELLRIQRAAQAGKFVSPEELSLLGGNSITSKFANEEALRRGNANPDVQALIGLNGGQGVEQLQSAVNAMEAKITKAQLEATAKLSDSYATNLDRMAEQLSDAFVRALDNAIAKINNKVTLDRVNGLLQTRTAQGTQ